jgi:6-pyruvoyltetrahydropterin/6-carboxytetrahydropterin synthase
MSTISVSVTFCAGHRILGLDGPGAKCRNVHGHTFKATWVFEQSAADNVALEFGALKEILRSDTKTRYDHGFFVDGSDDAMLRFLDSQSCKHTVFDGPPTTERIVELLAYDCHRQFPTAKLRYVTLNEGVENAATWENPNYFTSLKRFPEVPV